MTLAMPDSIRSLDLPTGYPAYLGYVDGDWPTIHGYTDDHGVRQPPLRELFPQAHLIGLTVTGASLSIIDADGVDSERGDLGAASAAAWAEKKLAAHPGSRPVIYASVIGDPGFGMHEVIAALATRQVPLTSVRLLSAHYDWKGTGADPANRHICGPATCGLISLSMDGTQWTDVFPGNSHGSIIDMSVLRGDFFTTPPPQEDFMQFPGIPGSWITATQLIDAHGTEWVTGLGRDGLVYYTRRPAGGTWSAPALVA